MREGEPRFEMGISRHAPKPKKGVESDIRKEEIDKDQAREAVGPKAQELLSRLNEAPVGTVMALEPSNVIRAKQTRDLLAEKLGEMLEGRRDISLVSLGETEEGAAKVLGEVRANREMKYIIADLRPTWLLGSKENEPMVAAANKWNNRFGGNENLRGSLWASHKSERPRLRQKLLETGIDVSLEELNPAEFKHTPEEAALRQIRWMQAMRKIGERYFPNRSLILEGISHNIRADFASLALMGEDISLESIDRILEGKFREPFARSSTTFLADGSVEVTNRGMTMKYDRDEFENLLKRIRQNSEIRKKEWLEEG